MLLASCSLMQRRVIRILCTIIRCICILQQYYYHSLCNTCHVILRTVCNTYVLIITVVVPPRNPASPISNFIAVVDGLFEATTNEQPGDLTAAAGCQALTCRPAPPAFTVDVVHGIGVTWPASPCCCCCCACWLDAPSSEGLPPSPAITGKLLIITATSRRSSNSGVA